MENFKYIQENSVFIKHFWEQNTSQLIQVYNKNLNTKLNYITKAIKVNIEEDKFGDIINEGDTLFLSRYLVSCKKFKLSSSLLNGDNYSNIPPKLIMGRFKDNIISLNTLEMFFDKILVEPIKDLKIGSILLTQNSKCNIGKVIKHGKGGLFRDYTRKPMLVKENDVILYWNNTDTTLTLSGNPYSALEENRVIGIFKEGILEIDNLEMLDGRVLLKDMEEEKLDLQSSLVLPSKNNEFDYEFSSNNEFYYEVLKIGEKGREYEKGKFYDNCGVKVGDTVIAQGDNLQYVYFKDTKYYTVDNINNYIEAVIKKG